MIRGEAEPFAAIGPILSAAVVALLLALAATAHPHPEDEWLQQARTLVAWGEALGRGDTETVRALTAPGARPPPAMSGARVVLTSFATFTPGDGGVVASPVIVRIDGGTFTFALSVLLQPSADGWKVGSVTPAADVPPELLPQDLPEYADTRSVHFLLTDAVTGEPTYARVRITDGEGGYWPPDGHQKHVRTGWREDVGGDVSLDGATYAFVPPRFVARLPDGAFTLEARKGIEYLPASTEFSVGKESAPGVELSLPRWIDMRARGWIAGDTHTHFLRDQTALLEMQAEDLDLVYILATKWGELITDATAFTGRPSPVSTDHAVVVVNEESRHRWLGHTILHGIRSLVYPLTWGGPSEGVPAGYDFPPMAYQADAAHAQGGLVTWAHFPGPGGELAVDVALGKVDTVDLLTWNDAFAPGLSLSGDATSPSAADTYYLFLNTNARLPVTAGTDKMLNVQVMGSVRTYAHTGGASSYEAWLKALASGATMVTTGPVVTLTANGHPVGSELALETGDTVLVEATVEAPPALYPVDALEIVAGGQVIAATVNSESRSTLTASARIEATDSTWVAARARGSKLMPYQKWPVVNDRGIPPMAHTSPIYLRVHGRPVWVPDAARQLEAGVDRAIHWVQHEGRFRSEDDRRQMLALFEKAKAYYAAAPEVAGGG
jgi:hypothetical protein